MAEGDYWRFYDILERQVVTSPTVATPPETERVVLEQHTGTGEYRLRKLETVTEQVERE